MAISSWSTTAANNNAASPNGFPEGMAPSAYNDAARQLMADAKNELIPLINGLAALRAYSVASSDKISAYMYLSYRSSVGDGGHGIYRYVTGAVGDYTDNGGTIIVPSGGDGSKAWVRLNEGPVSLQVFGFFSSNGSATNDTALSNAVTWAVANQWSLALVLPGTYSISAKCSITGAGSFKFTCSAGAILNFTGTGTAFEFVNCNYSDVYLRLTATSITAGNAAVVVKESTGNSLYNRIDGVFLGPGKNATKPASGAAGTIGIRFVGPAAGQSNYFNRVNDTVRISGFDTGVYFEYLANANSYGDIIFDDFWVGVFCLADECRGLGGFWHQSAGNGTGNVECIRIGDATNFAAVNPKYNQFRGGMMEPGSLARPLVIENGSGPNEIEFIDNTSLSYSNTATSSNRIKPKDEVSAANFLYTIKSLILRGASNISQFCNETLTANRTIAIGGDGTNAQSGAFNVIFRFMGGSSQTRYADLQQVVGGKFTVTSSGGGIQLNTGAGPLTLSGIGSYANDAGAQGGGVAVGDVYFNTTNSCYTKRQV